MRTLSIVVVCAVLISAPLYSQTPGPHPESYDVKRVKAPTFQAKVLLDHNHRRELVSEAVGAVRVLLDEPYANMRRLQLKTVRQMDGISPPSAPLPPLEWDEALEAKALALARSCEPEPIIATAGADGTPPDSGHAVIETARGADGTTALTVLQMSHTNGGCLTGRREKGFIHADGCKMARLLLREDARMVGCAQHSCGEDGEDKWSIACAYDVSDRASLPWKEVQGVKVVTIDRRLNPGDVPKVAVAEEEGAFKPGLLNDEVHTMIKAAFVEDVEELRQAVSTPRLVGLRFAANSRSSDMDDLSRWKPSFIEEALEQDRESLRLADGRDIFELLAAKEPFPPIRASPQLQQRAQGYALKCSRPHPTRMLSIVDDLGDGYYGLWDAREMSQATPKDMVALMRKIMRQRITAHVGALSMVGEEAHRPYNYAAYVYRGMLADGFEFGCAAAECAPSTFAVACIIPKMDTEYITRTPYPSLFNDDPPANWRKP